MSIFFLFFFLFLMLPQKQDVVVVVPTRSLSGEQAVPARTGSRTSTDGQNVCLSVHPSVRALGARHSRPLPTSSLLLTNGKSSVQPRQPSEDQMRAQRRVRVRRLRLNSTLSLLPTSVSQ